MVLTHSTAKSNFCAKQVVTINQSHYDGRYKHKLYIYAKPRQRIDATNWNTSGINNTYYEYLSRISENE